MQKGNEKNQDQGTKATHTLKQSVHKKDKSTPFEAWKKYYDDWMTEKSWCTSEIPYPLAIPLQLDKFHTEQTPEIKQAYKAINNWGALTMLVSPA